MDGWWFQHVSSLKCCVSKIIGSTIPNLSILSFFLGVKHQDMGFAIHDCYTNIIPILFETLPWRSNSKAGEAFQMHQGLGKCMAGGAVRCAMCILFFAWDNFQYCWGPTDLLLAEVYHKYKSQIATKFDWYYNHIYIYMYLYNSIYDIHHWELTHTFCW